METNSSYLVARQTGKPIKYSVLKPKPKTTPNTVSNVMYGRDFLLSRQTGKARLNAEYQAQTKSQQEAEAQYLLELEEYNSKLKEQELADAEYKKQLAEYEKQKKDADEYNLSKEKEYQDELKKYNEDLLKYESDKTKYEEDLAEYEKQKKEYDSAMAKYNTELAEYNRNKAESNDWEYAKELVFAGKGWITAGDYSTEGKLTSLNYKVNWLAGHGYQSAERMVMDRELPTKPTYTFTDSLGQPMSIDPEKIGYQGMTTKEGVVFVKPQEPSKKTPTVFSLSQPAQPSILSNILEPPKTVLTKAIEPTKITAPTMNILKPVPKGMDLPPAPKEAKYIDPLNQGVSYDPIKSSLGTQTVLSYKPTNNIKAAQQDIGITFQAGYQQSLNEKQKQIDMAYQAQQPKNLQAPSAVLMKKPSLFENIKQTASMVGLEARKTYSDMFQGGTSLEPLSLRQVAGEVATGFFIEGPKRAGQLPGVLQAELGLGGYKVVNPERAIPQRVTSGGEFKLPESKYTLFTPQGTAKVGVFGADVVKYTTLSPGVLFAGALAIAQSPQKSFVTNENRIEAAFMALPLTLKSTKKVIEKPVNYFFGKNVYELPIKQNRYTSADFIEPIQTPNAQISKGTFILESNVPAREAVVESRVNRYFRNNQAFNTLLGEKNVQFMLQPEIITLSKAQKYVSVPIEPITTITATSGDKSRSILLTPSNIATKRVSGKPQNYFTINKIEGGQETIGDELSIGALQSTKIGRFNPDANTVNLFDYGKRISQSETYTYAKQIENPVLKDVQVFETDTIVRDVTKPFSRVQNKAPYIQGVSIIKNPKYIDVPESAGSLGFSNVVTKTQTKPDTKVITDVLTKTKSLVIKDIPKPKGVKPIIEPIKIPTTSITKQESGIIKSSILETPQVTKSAYYGTGTYERYQANDNVFKLPNIKTSSTSRDLDLGSNPFDSAGNIGENSFSNLGGSGKYNDLGSMGRFNDLGTTKSRLSSLEPVKPKSRDEIETRIITKPSTKEISVLKPVNNFKDSINSMQQPMLKEISILKNILKEDTLQRTKQKQTQKFVDQFKSVLKTNTIQTGIFKTPTPKINEKINPFKPSKLGSKKDISNKPIDLAEAYKTFILRRGKKEYLKNIGTRSEAVRLGEQTATKTLAATFGVEKTGRIIKAKPNFDYRPSSTSFRDYKIKSGMKTPLKDTWIQKAPKRLSARTEVSEIISSKRRKLRQSLF